MKTIIEIIESRLDGNKSNCSFTYLSDGGSSQMPVSLEEIREAAVKFSQLLPKEVPILLLLPQGISFIKAFFGCLYAPTIAVPVAVPSKHRGLDRLKSIVADAGIFHGITNRETLDNLRKWFGEDELLSKIEWFLVEDIERQTAEKNLPVKAAKLSQIAFLQYTSGSTGNPKGVMVTHENIVANSEILRTFFKNTSESVSVCWLPAFHDMGLIDGIIQPVFSDFKSVLMSPTHFLQKPLRWLKALSDYRADYSGAPNFAFDLCVDRIKDEELAGIDLSNLRCLYNASEPIRHQTMQRFLDKFSSVGFAEKHLFTCYGLAEATLAVTASKLGTKPTVLKIDAQKMERAIISPTANLPYLEITASGYTYCDTTLKIVDPQNLEELEDGKIGEILVSGKSVTAGYLNASVNNQNSFIERNGTRFLRTGDLGFLLNQELFVTGRIKDLIIIRGANYYPQDIEQTVYSAHPALETNKCAAFSVEIEQDEKLIVVQEIKRTFRRNADYPAIFSEILGAVSKEHGLAPHDVVLIAPNALPQTSSGKVRRDTCRKLWKAQELRPAAVLRNHLRYEKIPQ